jgi:hypothetical protein
MPDTDPEATMLTQRQLGSGLAHAIDEVRDAVTGDAWVRADIALAELLRERTTLRDRTTTYVLGRLGPVRAAWLDRWLDARPDVSRSNGAGSDVDGVDLELDRG